MEKGQCPAIWRIYKHPAKWFKYMTLVLLDKSAVFHFQLMMCTFCYTLFPVGSVREETVFEHMICSLVKI